MYVYVKDKNALESLPQPVLHKLGEPELALEFELSPERKLGQENAADIIASLETQGFHIQMPRNIEELLTRVSNSTTGSDSSS